MIAKIKSAFSGKARRPAPTYRRNYQIGDQGRLLDSWFSGSLTADEAIFSKMTVGRNRARDLERQNPFARRFLQMVATNVVGPHGIALQPLARRADGALDEADNAALLESWRAWGKVGSCTIDHRLAWPEVQAMLLRRVLVDGEAMLRLIRGADNASGFAVQIVDATLLDENKTQDRGRGRVKIVMGVEVDKNDRPVAYHFKKSASALGAETETTRVPASEIVHLYLQERPDQTRGFTWLAPSAVRVKMLDAFEEAAVVAARVAACKMGFFTSEEGAAFQGDGAGDGLSVLTDVEPGSLQALEAGQNFQAFDPAWPPNNFAEFEKELKRGIASGWGVNYTTLANDLEGVNYSSIRQGELADRDFWRCLQQFLVRHLADVVYGEWLLMALSAGSVQGAGGPLPLARLDKFRARSWRPRGWQWVDPAKEISAARDSFLLRQKSLTDLAAEQGLDFAETARQIKEDIALAERLGLSLPGNDAAPGAAMGDETNEG